MTSTDHDDNWDLSPASSFVRVWRPSVVPVVRQKAQEVAVDV